MTWKDATWADRQQKWLRETRRQDPARADLPLTAQFDRADPGNPLGVGMPLGRSLREDGESHREAWMRVCRADPCAFCGRMPSGTLDHIEPKSRPARGIGGVHSWVNYTGACSSCNGGKNDTPLLEYLARRRSWWRVAAA